MTLQEVLALVEERGIKLRLEGEGLGFRAPKGALTPELRDLLAQRKLELLQFLRGAGAPQRTPLAPRGAPQGTPGPLCAGQARLWFLDRLSPGSALYNVHSGLRMLGPLDRGALERALTALVARHSMLRATFPLVDGEPRMLVAEPAPWPVPFVDLRGAADASQRLQTLWREHAQAPYDLARGPLMRTTLVALSDQEHVLLVGHHHIVTDAVSIALLGRDVFALYQSCRDGSPAGLPPLPVRFEDWAQAQQEALASPSAQKAAAFWRSELAGLPRLELPTAVAHARTHQGDIHTFSLSLELTQSLKALSQQHGCTLYVTLLLGWASLLSRYAGQSLFGVGTVTSGRDREELRDLVGFFVNTLVLRCDLSGDPTLPEALERLRSTVTQALEHQDLPFDRILAASAAERGSDFNPLFRAAFGLEQVPLARHEANGIRWSAEVETVDGAVRGSAKFELGLTMLEVDGALQGTLEYATDLFGAQAVERIALQLTQLLRSMVESPTARLSELSAVEPAERRLLLERWNDTAEAFDGHLGLHQLVEQWADQTPEAPAVQGAGETLSYRALDARANQLARRLQGHGVRPGSRVAVCLPRAPEMVVALLAVLKAGAAYVPLDPGHPPERLRSMLRDTGAPLVISCEALASHLPEGPEPRLLLEREGEAIAAESPQRLALASEPDAVAYVLYTSGSTGAPKGVVVEHRGVVNLAQWHLRTFAVGPGERLSQVVSLGFDAAGWEIWPSLLGGACLVIAPDELRAAPAPLVEWMVAERITVGFLPTPLAELVLTLRWPQQCALRVLSIGGDRLHRTPPPGLPFRVINVYGPTETTIASTTAEIAPGGLGEPLIGRPLANTQIYVLDEQQRLLPIGAVGELCIGGEGVSRGYLNRDALTRERFVPNPFRPGHLIYRTGDRARWLPDGQLQCLGRTDRQVKVRGTRVELGEIESALLTHAALGEAAVVAREHAGELRLFAYVAAARGQRCPSSPELEEHLRHRLPSPMIPSAFVQVEALPLNANGKVDRDRLPTPDRAESAQTSEAQALPAGSLEARLCALWAEVLQVPTPGLRADFFSLGGHSLLAVRLLQAVEDRFGRAPPLSAFLQRPTVSALVEHLKAPGARERSVRTALQPAGTDQPFFCIEPGLGGGATFVQLAQALGTGRPFYSLSHRGLFAEELARESVEELAAELLAPIREVAPGGPYLLGGHSFGGLVAFEVARQLLRDGQQVGALVLLDTLPPQALAEQVPELALRLFLREAGLSLSPAQLLQLESSERRSRLASAWAAAGGLPADGDRAQLERLIAWRTEHVPAAHRSYRPAPIAVQVTLVQASVVPQELAGWASPAELAQAWKPLCSGGLRVLTAPGDHFSMLAHPHINQLADELRRTLDGTTLATHQRST